MAINYNNILKDCGIDKKIHRPDIKNNNSFLDKIGTIAQIGLFLFIIILLIFLLINVDFDFYFLFNSGVLG